MYAIIVIVISTWISLVCTVVSHHYMDLSWHYKSENREFDQTRIADRLRSDYGNDLKIYGSYADIINDNPDLRYTSDQIEYALSNDLSDGTWEYKRFVLFSQNPQKRISFTDFLSVSKNVCGSQNFYNDESWCVRLPNAKWWTVETREDYINRIKDQHTRLEKTLKKFIKYFNKNQKFPVTKPDSTILSSGEQINLPSFVGYGGTAENCDGPYDLHGIPLNCDDIYDQYGNKVYYTLNSTSSIYLFVNTKAKSSSGNYIYASEGVKVN